MHSYFEENSIMRLKLLSVVLFAFLLGACSVPKDVVYLQGVDQLTPERLKEMSQTYTTRIVPDDMLNITVAAWDPTVTTPFNPPTYAYAKEGEQPVFASQTMYNYIVDKDGYINFPVLGRIKVEGLTREEISRMLEKDISKYIKDPLVTVQLVNFKVTLMGEIARPGGFTIKTDRISVFDAIGLGGDLTINADRKNVLVIRDNKGVKEFARLDLTSPELLASPYYYLQQNDVIYIEPNKAKKKNSRYSQAEQYNVTVFSSVISAVSIITAMVVSIVNATSKN